MLIRGLVYGESQEDALFQAKTQVFDRLVEDHVFDYYVTADMDGRGVSGTDRWGEFPAAVPADTDEGRELADQGWESTEQEYERALARIEEFFEGYAYDELWEDKAVHTEYQYQFFTVGQFEGSSTFLYDPHGQGIRDRPHLDEYLQNDGYGQQTDDEELYVIPADVHY